MPDDLERYRVYVQHVPYGLLVVDASGGIREVNPAICRMTGFSETEFAQLSIPDLAPLERREEALRAFGELRIRGELGVEIPLVCKDGKVRVAWLEAVALPDGSFLGLCSELEHARREVTRFASSRERYELHVRQTPLGVIEWDLEFRVIEWNPAAERIFGYTRAQAVGRHAMELIVPAAVQEHVDAIWFALLEQHGGKRSTNENVTRSGERIFCEWYNTPLIADDGRTIGVASLVQDITGRRRAEQERQEHLGFLQSLERIEEAMRAPGELDEVLGEVLQAVLGIFDCDRAFLFHPCDPQTQTVRLGMERSRPEYPGIFATEKEIPVTSGVAALLGELLAADLPIVKTHPEGPGWDPEDRYSIRAMMQIALYPKHGAPWSFGLHQCSRARIWTEEEQLLFREIGRRIGDALSSLLALRDLRASEARFRRIAENARDMIYRMSLPDGRYEYVSPASSEIFGRSPEEIYASPLLVRDSVHPDWREYYEEQWERLLVGDMPPEYEYQIRHPSGEVRWLYQRNVLVRDADGRPAAIEGIVTDVTARKRMERERREIEAKMLHAQKLESLGVLAGGIAHDFNNLLVAIMGNADLALLDAASNAPVVTSVEEIKKAAKRASELTNQMLAYSGRGRFLIESLDLGELVEEMGHILEVSISKKCTLRYDRASGMPAVSGDPSQMRQVVMNLITNASDAIGEENGIISVRTYAVQADERFFRGATLGEGCTPGSYVCLEVGDTGCGMGAEPQARLFEPFFSTKFTGRGLGLAAVLGIVRGHRGAIRIRTEEGTGSTFQVFFPAQDAMAEREARGAAPATDAGWRGSGRVLVADDEESVRSLARTMLQRLGYEVVTACDGAEAVKLYAAQPDQIALVLLDLTMPRIGGLEALHEIRALRPHAKAILFSGYGEADARRHTGSERPDGFLQKPFEMSALVELLRSLE